MLKHEVEGQGQRFSHSCSLLVMPISGQCWDGCGPAAGAQLWLSLCLQPSSEVGSRGIAVPAGVAVAALGPFNKGGVGPCSYQLALMELARLAQRRL